jgi:hypothetical protein
MKKTLVKGIALAFVGSLLVAGSAMALTLGTEYELINPDLVGTPTYIPGTDLGYYIWVDDVTRTDWHLRWSGAGPDTVFAGTIGLEGNTFDSFIEFSFEGADLSYNLVDSAGWIAIANVGQDGIDFSISKIADPSYVGFDLFMDGNQQIGDNIYFGSLNETAAMYGSDGDFKVNAPVPEPATMLLMGSGLVGLAGAARRRKNKKA